MLEPHGGTLVDGVAEQKQAQRIRTDIGDAPTLHLDDEQLQKVVNIATGRFSPLDGFLSRNDFYKVVNDGTLEDGTVWPLPIVLDVPPETADELTPSQTVGLRHEEEGLVASLEIEDVYKYNKEQTVAEVFDTTDRSHPGVDTFLSKDEYLVGGEVTLFDERYYGSSDLLPRETRVLFREYGWDTVVGFQTRNAPHRAHEYLQKICLELFDGLLVQPKLGEKKEGDYTDETILGAYEVLIDNYYPEQRAVMSVYPSKMHYAGPREALLDALVRKNHGCTHFIVGRDHAGVGDFYEPMAAHRIFDEFGDIGIEPLFFDNVFYCNSCGGMASEQICPHDDTNRVYPSGSEIRRQIRNGERPSKKVIRPEVAQYILDDDNRFVESKHGVNTTT